MFFSPDQRSAVDKITLCDTANAQLASSTPTRSQWLLAAVLTSPIWQWPDLPPFVQAALSGSPKVQRSTNMLNRGV